MEVFPGVYQLKVPIPSMLGYLNSYLVRGGNGCLLVDTGWNNQRAFQSLKEQLAELRLSFRDITTIVITHAAQDHYGLAGRIRQMAPNRFAFHIREQALIEERYVDFAQFQSKMRQFLRTHGVPSAVAGSRRRVSVTPVPPDKVLYGGEVLSVGEFQLEVLWTPGHSPGHVCLHEPSKKLLFSGDHLLPVITPNVSYNLYSGSNPLGDFINSLNQLRRLPVNLILPGHEHVFEGLEARVQEIMEHHDERKRRIMAILAREPQTAFLIAGQVPWNIPGGWPHLDHPQQRSAVTETIAHLELLCVEGQVERFSRDGITFYELVS